MSHVAKPATRVLVYGLQRSGTTWISSVIDQLDGARCAEEVLLETPVLPGSYRSEAPALFPAWRRILRPVRSRVDFLDQLLSPSTETPIVGAKLMYPQIGWPVRLTGRLTRRWPQLSPLLSMRSLRRWMIDRGVVVVLVERRNVLKLRISELIAQQSGIIHSTDGARSIRGIHLDPSTLVSRLDRTQRRQQAARRFLKGCEVVEILYESREEDKRLALQAALGLEAAIELETRYRKVTADDLRISILNYDEVAEALRGTRFEWCLEEQPPA